MADSESGKREIRVWPIGTRLLHWTLAVATITAWVLHEGGERMLTVHEWLGYAALALVALRLAWGFAGPSNKKFSRFLMGPRKTLSYADSILKGGEPRYLNHNPLGGWMIVALILAISVASISGWLSTTERYWGIGWVIELHRISSNVLLILILLHVAGVIFTSIRQGENLIGSMIRGRKPSTTRRHPEDAIDRHSFH
ncbi:MAG: cytochrome b/b6 domain-containing protein [Albidovulum sp.]|nr:cytochrome b/b6 domain-containing protein [Albidovulum sp.]